MFRFIEQLQKKPEREKRAIALGLAGGITGVIVILWLMGISLYAPAPQDAARAATEETGPVGSIGESVGAFWNDATRAVGEIKRVVSGTPESFAAPEAPLEKK